MSLANLVNNNSHFEDVDAGYISESAMNQLCTIMALETLNPEEMDQYLTESIHFEGVTEAQKNIVKLNKQAKFNRAYKVGVLQCAAEANDKLYKKIRTIWKLEAKIFGKMEQRYKNKAMAKAREAIKQQSKRKGMGATVANRMEKNMKGAKTLLQSGPVKIGK